MTPRLSYVTSTHAFGLDTESEHFVVAYGPMGVTSCWWMVASVEDD